jgi:hypothetical protein
MKEAIRLRNEVAAEMSERDIATAQRAARDWLVRHWMVQERSVSNARCFSMSRKRHDPTHCRDREVGSCRSKLREINAAQPRLFLMAA